MGKIKSLVSNFVSHWNKPAAGRYVSYKEVAAYSVGGMGVQFIAAMMGNISMTASCILVGSVFGLQPVHLGLLTSLATIIALVFQPIKSAMIDNTRSKRGKARPYIFWLGPPVVILMIAVTFIDPNWDYIVKLALIGSAYMILNIIYNFYLGMYGQLVQLMSPNTDERAGIISVSSIIYSFAPTITGFVLPLIADAFPGGLTDIKVYRIVLPIFCLLGLAMGYIAYFGTKERIVVSKKYEAKVKFWDGLKKIIVNKYFWITNVSGWFAFLRGAAGVMLGWGYIYMLQNNTAYSFLSLVAGTASLIGMVTAPFIIKAIGKKWTVIITNILMGIMAVLLFFTTANFIVIFLFFYLFNGSAAVQIITAPAMNADALDYQQWKTGDRLEGFSGNLSIFGSIIALGTNLIIPIVYELFGLVGNYDILYVPEIRTPMFQMLCIMAAIGAVLTAAPYFFWDLSEKKHRALIEDLKERAIEDDAENGIVETEEALEARLMDVTVMELLNEKLRSSIITQEEYDDLLVKNNLNKDNVNVESNGSNETDELSNVIETEVDNSANNLANEDQSTIETEEDDKV